MPPGLASITWKTYLVFGMFNFAAMIHIFFVFPETKQRTLEEVEDIFTHVHPSFYRKVENVVGANAIAGVKTPTVGVSIEESTV